MSDTVELTKDEEADALARYKAGLAAQKAAKAKASVEAKAWNSTKDKNDPEWDLIPNQDFKGKLQFAADRVKATGTAQTNFEHKVLELHKEELEKEAAVGGPLAVVTPQAGLDAAATSPMAVVGENPVKPPTDAEKAAAQKELEKAKVAPDHSGHVPAAEEAAATAKEQEVSPQHP